MQEQKTLSKKHYLALTLIENSTNSINECGRLAGFTKDEFDELLSGGGKTLRAELFWQELDEIRRRSRKKTKLYLQDNLRLIQQRLNEYLREMQIEELTDDNLKKLLAIVKSMAAATPKVQIDEQHNYSTYTQGELLSEFQKFRGLAAVMNRGKKAP
jgi:hypothetical protein